MIWIDEKWKCIADGNVKMVILRNTNITFTFIPLPLMRCFSMLNIVQFGNDVIVWRVRILKIMYKFVMRYCFCFFFKKTSSFEPSLWWKIFSFSRQWTHHRFIKKSFQCFLSQKVETKTAKSIIQINVFFIRLATRCYTSGWIEEFTR